MSKEIPLTQGYVAIVDDEDFERFGHFNWCVLKCLSGNLYALRRPKGTRKGELLHRSILNAPAGV
ncbi:hypothetical protein [Telmatospirillum sp.]|uniref:hypothetical protein n=1 Tax=Telmatospirillum sp. TaxID=2079197 RepID=UPI00284CBEC7|nr:hypothetical protein [Telmatospirillum sp.]MDR3436470.1 hypothetical protein [Telmatospirillum sp.]